MGHEAKEPIWITRATRAPMFPHLPARASPLFAGVMDSYIEASRPKEYFALW